MEDIKNIKPLVSVMASTAMAQSIKFCTERKYLRRLGDECFSLKYKNNEHEAPLPVYWLKINRVGKPLDDSYEYCFSAIQKILQSYHSPGKIELLFLVKSENKLFHLYIGQRYLDDKVPSFAEQNQFKDFIESLWPGVGSENISKDSVNIYSEEDIQKISSGEINPKVLSITGIPSMESQYDTLYPATMDRFLSGMRNSKDFSYMIIAAPIHNDDVDNMLYQCHEMSGQAESLKEVNITDGISSSVTETDSISNQKSTTVGTSQKDFSPVTENAKKLWNSDIVKKIRSGNIADLSLTDGEYIAGGLATTAGICKAAAACGAAVYAAGGAAAVAGVGLGVAGLGMGLLPQKNTTEAETNGIQHSIGTTLGTSETISKKIVNKHVETVCKYLDVHAERFEKGKAIGMWKVGAYLISNYKDVIDTASYQIKAILSGNESIYEPILAHDITHEILKEKFVKTLQRYQNPILDIVCTNKSNEESDFDHPFGTHYHSLQSVLTTKELSYFINFPLRSIPGISVIDTCPEFNLTPLTSKDEKDIKFGKVLYNGSETNIDFQIPFEALSRHILLTGINGSGKTNTVQAILNGINDIPFLVIEPAKTEYVDWAIKYNKNHPENKPIKIFIPGCKRYKNTDYPKEILKINPFSPVWLDENQDPNVLSHIDRLKSIFATAFPMYDILPVLLEDLIYSLYMEKSRDWLTNAPIYGRTKAPTLNWMSAFVDKVMRNRGYEDSVERNLKACLNTRIDSLKRGWKGEMLNNLNGNTEYDQIFDTPCVINLSYVGDDVDKGFFMALILQMLYEYRMAQAECGKIDFNDNGCRHLTIIEEAHRVMSKCENMELPQYKSAMVFSNMLSEIRAYGEGMMLVDQIPTRLIPDAIKNTNLKIVHRLVSQDDTNAMAESMGLNEEQTKLIPKLLTGQCVVSSSLATDSYWIKSNKVK